MTLLVYEYQHCTQCERIIHTIGAARINMMAQVPALAPV